MLNQTKEFVVLSNVIEPYLCTRYPGERNALPKQSLIIQNPTYIFKYKFDEVQIW